MRRGSVFVENRGGKRPKGEGMKREVGPRSRGVRQRNIEGLRTSNERKEVEK